MIERYARPEMTAIWSPESKYGIWLEIETLAAEAMESLGQIPEGTSKAVPGQGTAGGLQKPGKDAQQTRFSRAVGSAKNQRAAGQEFKREGAENRPFSPNT